MLFASKIFFAVALMLAVVFCAADKFMKWDDVPVVLDAICFIGFLITMPSSIIFYLVHRFLLKKYVKKSQQEIRNIARHYVS